MKILLERGIITQVHYIPIPIHPFYKKKGYNMKKLKKAKIFYDEILSIPIFYNLKNKSQKYLIREILRVLK